MTLFKERSSPVRIFGRRLLFIGIIAATGLLIPGVWKVYQQERGSRFTMRETKLALTELKEREAYLEKETNELATPRGVEEILRTQFSLAKAGEGLIVIVDRNTADTAMEKQSSFWQWFERIFKW